MRCRVAFVCGWLWLSATATAAQEPEAPKSVERHGVSPVVELGWYDGLVVGLQLDLSATAIRASGGYMPLILLTEQTGFDVTPGVELLHGGQFNGDFIWYFWAPTARSRIGMSIGYHYNTILQHGAGVAFQGEAVLDVDVSIYYVFGIAGYWRGNELAERELGRPGLAFNFPFGAGLQGGGGVGLIFPL